ncbi:cytochrome c550 [Lederbergia lenta]|uniref:Cytochrome c class I n=1 Tax=Lederbergia lenta TaxID=1467 RepID=A0A2X4VV58_LEDLE|nr:cytochrome c [Lederbergia lenta]MCM3111396.1 cytochrome c [Lederbergia lenta]MEC2325217.1 cytochrome c [Lederbergia lenta]SQI55936.1 cytochrome c class I [Lederbergia lenta]
MKRNAIVPYILIMVLGLGLIFFLGIKGIGDSKEIAKEQDGGTQEETVAFEPEEFANTTCITCHGENLEGAGAPSLHGTGLSEDEIADILVNGTDGGMPGGLVNPENVEEMAAWIAELK